MDKLLKVSEIAEYLKLDQETIRRWLQSGKLKGLKLGGSGWRVEEQELIMFIKRDQGLIDNG